MMNWDDIRLFLAVARAAGLVGAVGATGSSAPTLGRRILALERELGIQLFERHRLGYELTNAGQEFFERSLAVEQGANGVERWRMAFDPQPVVKIAAGPWTNTYIARHLAQITSGLSPLRIELLTGIDFVDLARREANLGIRNKRPHQQGLACRKIGQVDFAIYGASDYVDSAPEAKGAGRYQNCDWVALSSGPGAVPSISWLEQHMTRPARVLSTNVHVIIDAVGNGAGLCILPVFIGEADARLIKLSANIKELASTRWLVSHDDDRHDKAINHVAKNLAKLFLTVQDEQTFNGNTDPI